MNAPHTACAYDAFERFLLDTAKHDRAPQDLPARLGVALGLSMPILVAAETVTASPVLTTVSGTGAVELSSAVAPSGLAATLKAALGLGASTLLSTAIRGVAVGALSGTAFIGTGHAVAKLTDPSPREQRPTSVLDAPHRAAPPLGRRTLAPRSVTEPHDLRAPISNPASETQPSTEQTATAAVPAQVARIGVETSRAAKVDGSNSQPAWPTVPEKTTALARFASLRDDVSALYDTPKLRELPPGAPTVPIAPSTIDLSPADLSALRAETISRVRTLLGQGRATKALAELDSYRDRVGAKNFGVGELLLRIESLTLLGRAKEAQANVAIVEKLAPASSTLRQAQQIARSRFVR